MKTLNWGIIGCSDIANKRGAPAINEQEDSKLVAFLSHSIERAKEFAFRHKADRFYDDRKDFLRDKEINCVYVASPLFRHCEDTIAAAEAGECILCEKPMAMNPKECQMMIEACRKNKVKLAIAYYRRYYPKAKKIKEIIDKGLIGKIIVANIGLSAFWNPGSNDPKYWRVIPEKGGGGLLWDMGSHYFDLLCYFLGEPEMVCGFTDHILQPYKVPDSESALVKFKGNVHVTATFHWNLPGFLNTFEIHGTKGSLKAAPFDGEKLILERESGVEEFRFEKAANVHFSLIDDFTERILNNKEPKFSGEEGMKTTKILSGIYESACMGRTVILNDKDKGS